MSEKNGYSDNDKYTPNSDLVNYIKYLFQYLGEKYCFTSGSFVIQDNNDDLFSLLMSSKTNNLSKMMLTSHTIYMQDKKTVEKKDSKRGKKIKKTDDKYDLYETVFFTPIYIECNESNLEEKNDECKENPKSVRIFKSCKWYLFEYKKNKLIFLKPEDNPTINPFHGMQAISRYIFRISNKSCVKPRREDCEREHNCRYDPLEYSGNFENYDYMNDKDVYERKGDEVFISNNTNIHILNHIYKKIFEVNKNSVTLKGGGKKNKTKKQKRYL